MLKKLLSKQKKSYGGPPQWHVLQWYWCMYVFLCLLFLLRTTPHITLTNTNHIRELRISKILPIGFGTSSIQEKYHCYVVFKWYCQFSGYSRVLVVVCLIVFPRLLFKSMLQLFCRLNDTSLETLSSLSGGSQNRNGNNSHLKSDECLLPNQPGVHFQENGHRLKAQLGRNGQLLQISI